jgi:hypothetical protein
MVLDYKNGQIYAIVNEEGKEVYIGSSCQPLYKRWYQHKQDSKRRSHFNVYKHIEECGGFEKFRIILVEEYPCENKKQLERREGEHIKRINPVGNRFVAGRTQKEYNKLYREQNREGINERRREYYDENRDRINERRREYHEQTCNHINERRRKYYEENRDRINERKRKYYEENRDRINERKRERYRLKKEAEKAGQ